MENDKKFHYYFQTIHGSVKCFSYEKKNIGHEHEVVTLFDADGNKIFKTMYTHEIIIIEIL